jgi:R3H domain
MLKTEAFDVESSSHLTDKQRRKLEKKQERERKKENNMTTKKQKKMMKEMDENVDLRKIDQYVFDTLLAHMKPINLLNNGMFLYRKLQQFIRDDSISSYQMAPMAKYTRRQVHLLATAYNLKSKSLGSGNSR